MVEVRAHVVASNWVALLPPKLLWMPLLQTWLSCELPMSPMGLDLGCALSLVMMVAMIGVMQVVWIARFYDSEDCHTKATNTRNSRSRCATRRKHSIDFTMVKMVE